MLVGISVIQMYFCILYRGGSRDFLKKGGGDFFFKKKHRISKQFVLRKIKKPGRNSKRKLQNTVILKMTRTKLGIFC